DTNADGLSDVIMTGIGHVPGYCENAKTGQIDAEDCGTAPHDGPWSSDLPFLFRNAGRTFADIAPTFPASLVDVGWTDTFHGAATSIDYDGDGRMDLIMPIFEHCGPGTENGDACWVVLRSSVTGEGMMSSIDTHIRAIPDDDHGQTIPERFMAKV